MKVLLVEDEPRVASFIKKGLEENNIVVAQAFDGASGLKLALQDDYDVIILDVIMPVMNGIQVCTSIREAKGTEPSILMLTAAGTTDDIVDGLNVGADDYMVKPFKFRELLARVNALARRRTYNVPVMKAGDLEMNVDKKEVIRAGKLIRLTAREFRLLEYLLKNKGRVLSRVSILEHVWDVNHDLGTNVVEVYINYLRKKIDVGFETPLIKTVVGMGYTLNDSES